MDKNERDLSARLFKFAVSVIQFLRKLDNAPEVKIIKYQLTKSSTSSGANYEESQAASSRADFFNKIKISLREMRESNYWLRLIKATEMYPKEFSNDLDMLIKESEELKNIFGSISSKYRKD
jgi:four helix bundle protein